MVELVPELVLNAVRLPAQLVRVRIEIAHIGQDFFLLFFFLCQNLVNEKIRISLKRGLEGWISHRLFYFCGPLLLAIKTLPDHLLRLHLFKLHFSDFLRRPPLHLVDSGPNRRGWLVHLQQLSSDG